METFAWLVTLQTASNFPLKFYPFRQPLGNQVAMTPFLIEKRSLYHIFKTTFFGIFAFVTWTHQFFQGSAVVQLCIAKPLARCVASSEFLRDYRTQPHMNTCYSPRWLLIVAWLTRLQGSAYTPLSNCWTTPTSQPVQRDHKNLLQLPLHNTQPRWPPHASHTTMATRKANSTFAHKTIDLIICCKPNLSILFPSHLVASLQIELHPS